MKRRKRAQRLIQLQCRFPRDILEEIEAISDSAGVSRAEVVRKLVHRSLFAQKIRGEEL
jgi:metal-responsive CopG/Arc/MetJ family transcriptional regulator